MPDPVREGLLVLLDGGDLSEEQTAAAIGAIMDGAADDVVVAGLLSTLCLKGETVDELVGAAQAMRSRARGIPIGAEALLDTCGTGGDGLATFNISTAAALVAAAAGVPVAKHGNRAASSASGSADVLEALGVRIDLDPEQVARCVGEVGIGFCFAPICHGAMKHVAPVRRRLKIRTIFNLLGPLTNPAGAAFQLVGTGRLATARLLAQSLSRLPIERAVVVCGNDELDEVSLWGTTTALIIEGGAITETEWRAEDLTRGGPIAVEELRVNSPAESAAAIRRALENEPSAAREMVLVNAAAALLAAGRVTTITEGCALAEETLAGGRAAETLSRLSHFTQEIREKPGECVT